MNEYYVWKYQCEEIPSTFVSDACETQTRLGHDCLHVCVLCSVRQFFFSYFSSTIGTRSQHGEGRENIYIYIYISPKPRQI